MAKSKPMPEQAKGCCPRHDRRQKAGPSRCFSLASSLTLFPANVKPSGRCSKHLTTSLNPRNSVPLNNTRLFNPASPACAILDDSVHHPCDPPSLDSEGLVRVAPLRQLPAEPPAWLASAFTAPLHLRLQLRLFSTTTKPLLCISYKELSALSCP